MSSFSRVISAGQRIASPGQETDDGRRTLRQAEFAAERPHLVLEEFAQRLDKLHVHARGQTADIVV